MGYGLKDIPRTEFGQGFGVTAADLATGFILPATGIAQGGLLPDRIGIPVVNKSGGTITQGTLVYVFGWDATANRSTIAKASASAESTTATYVVLADIANNANGNIGKHLAFAGQNTNAATVGDAVYLDTTAGGYTLTNPPGTGVVYQRVGRVATKSASGMIEFELLSAGFPVTVERLQSHFPSIATTGTTESAPIIMDRAGSVLGFRLAFLTALAINGTNFVTFTVNNRSQTLLMTAAVVTNSTNTSGQAVNQYGGYGLTVTATPANLVVAAADVITCLATITGTLGGVLGPGSFSLILAPS